MSPAILAPRGIIGNRLPVFRHDGPVAQVSWTRGRACFKIVYCGPPGSGKTTNLEVVHRKVPSPELPPPAPVEAGQVIFFGFRVDDMTVAEGLKTWIYVYTVPGPVAYPMTWKLLLEGADAVIFVADSAASRAKANPDAMAELRQRVDVGRVPVVLQYNKRDLPDAEPAGSLEDQLNPAGGPVFEAIATRGEGVWPTLMAAVQAALARFRKENPGGPKR
jgi:hypothetical protein